MLLDTTFLIDFLRGEEKAIKFMQKNESGLIFTTEINVFEIVTGVYASKDNIKEYLERINALLSNLIVLNLDRKSSIKAGEITGNLIKQGQKIQETDCLIAAIALTNGLNVIVTENKKHFERIKEIEVLSYV